MPTGSRLSEDIAAPAPSYSFEFFPPKTDAGERALWTAIRELEPLQPTFVSVTYGAGGSTRDRTVRITERIATETTLRPVGHLTCVGQSRDDLRNVLGQYAAAGVRNILALRGDPVCGPGTPWVPHPGGLEHGSQLVEMVASLGTFCVGAAAYPKGHREARSLDADADVVVAKANAGAEFAVTDFFFLAEDYFALVERVRARGFDIPIVPGIMPITNLGQITRMAELSGHEVPPTIVARLEPWADDPDALRAEGTQVASELCADLLAGGSPGLHFYTLNRSRATRRIFESLVSATV